MENKIKILIFNMSSWVNEYVSVLPLCSRDDLNFKKIQK